MIIDFKNTRTSKNNLLKAICLTALMLSGALQAMETQLETAIESGNIDQVRQLLKEGANVNAKIIDHDGMTPLMIAASQSYSPDHYAICKLLIEKGDDVNARIEEFSVLDSAADPKICQLLIEKGAKVNARDHKNSTVLINDLKRVAIGISILLIKNGAHVNIQDNAGNVPLTLALDILRNEYELQNERKKYEFKEAKELCFLIIDRMLQEPIDQAQLKALAQTQDRAQKRNKLIAFITTEIQNSKIQNQPLKQELLDHLKSRIK
jgi:hypothetical protein